MRTGQEKAERHSQPVFLGIVLISKKKKLLNSDRMFSDRQQIDRPTDKETERQAH